ncbi:hypothetical protein FGO68_gene6504 [Halteria grandinella]|uniref:Uncharacterized protein n=1 Tax=Halteria grandinella TaxID=5974 RepID=A0A8J8P210_HALGN|nr:hypothetical protein FGO68_gene6504 [Halteria grandinella]
MKKKPIQQSSGLKRRPELELGELYKLSADEYHKDRHAYLGDEAAILIDDQDDLSQHIGPNNERLPALENCLENSKYRFASSDPYRPPKPYLPRQAQKTAEDLIPIGTPEYHLYMKQVEDTFLEHKGTHYICMTCWKYVSRHQQNMHERLGHVCAGNGSIKDERTFMIKARTYGKLTEDGCFVQKFAEYDPHYLPPKDRFEAWNIKYSNTGDHNGDKGKPPIIGPMMLPIQLQPDPKVNIPKNIPPKPLSLTEIGGKSNELIQGSLALSFDSYEKERLAQVLGRLSTRMDDIENNVQDMMHKIKLMMVRDFQNLQTPAITATADDQWLEDDENTLMFNK